MEDKYEKERIPFLKQMPPNLGKYLYSPLGLGYFVTVMLGMTYLRFKGTYLQIKPRKKSLFRPYCPIS